MININRINSVNTIIMKYSIIMYLCLLSSSARVFASENDHSFSLPQSLQIHGFLSQGFLHTSDNNLFGSSDDGISVDFRELGINGSWRIIPELQLALQLVWRDAGQTDEDDLRIDYGLIDYSFFSSETTLLGFKAGRVPTPFGLYNDTRDVASTRPSVLLPQSIYFDRNRNLGLSADGGYFYAEQRTDYGDFFFNIGVVKPRTDDPSFKQSIAGNFAGKMVGETSWVTRLNYEWQNDLVRASITYGEFKARYKPESTVNNLLPGLFEFNPLIFSLQYNAEKWSLTTEYALRRIKLTNFGVFSDNINTGESFYIQGAYQLSSSIEALIRYDQYSVDINDKKGRRFAEKTGRPSYSRFAEDWTFGLRFKITSSLLISSEYHRINGTGWLSSLENRGTTTQYWDLYTLMISYDF